MPNLNQMIIIAPHDGAIFTRVKASVIFDHVFYAFSAKTARRAYTIEYWLKHYDHAGKFYMLNIEKSENIDNYKNYYYNIIWQKEIDYNYINKYALLL